MTFAPRFSPDGNTVDPELAVENGASNIYAMDLRTAAGMSRLTDGSAIDTSPCYSPDASQIVFNSDRGGSQQLYVMNADGSEIQRISFGQGKYGTPVWSPRGDLIAFTKIDGGQFYIGVMRPDGSGRAAPDARLSGRGTDLGAERPGADVFPRGADGFERSRGFAAALHDRFDRLQSARGDDAGRRFRPGVVALASIAASDIVRRLAARSRV